MSIYCLIFQDLFQSVPIYLSMSIYLLYLIRIYLSIYLSKSLHISLSQSFPIYLSIFLSSQVNSYLSIYLFLCIYIYIYICVCVCVCVCVRVCVCLYNVFASKVPLYLSSCTERPPGPRSHRHLLSFFCCIFLMHRPAHRLRGHVVVNLTSGADSYHVIAQATPDTLEISLFHIYPIINIIITFYIYGNVWQKERLPRRQGKYVS